LDTDGDNKINSNEFATKVIGEREIKILNPIITELKEKESMNFDDFSYSFQSLFDKIAYNDKKLFKDWYMIYKCQHSNKCCFNKENEEKYTFQPIVSERSHETIKNSARYSNSFMERNSKFIQDKQALLNESQIKKEKEPLDKECTFKPAINTLNPNSFRYSSRSEMKTIDSKEVKEAPKLVEITERKDEI